MKLKINQVLSIFLFSIGIGYSQVNTNGTVNPSITTENPFFDASTNFDSSVDPTSSGKGLVFPRTDLTTFIFKVDSMDGITFPTAFDGMIVYNSATGSTASGQGIVTTVTPGFYYFSNPTGSTSIATGEWKRIGSAIDPVNVFLNDATNTMVYVAKKSDGITTRTAGTEFVVKDNGNVGIGTSSPNNAAILDVNSTTKGFLPPRMTTAQIAAISSPVNGMVVYNTSVSCLQVYKINSWECIGVSLNVQSSFVATGYTGNEITGANATAHYNGWVSGSYTGTNTTVTHSSGEAFSTVATCANKYISVTPCTSTELSSGITDSDGNNYPVVTINGQCWMTKNMKQRPFYSRANTGTTWLNYSLEFTDVGSWGYYNVADPTGASGWASTEPGTDEGILYQWSAATNKSIYERSKGVCPTGYHVPSDCEFMYLEHGLGMPKSQLESESSSAAMTSRGVSSFVGLKLLSTLSFGNNSSGFSILPTGFRGGTTGSFVQRPEKLATFITSTLTNSGVTMYGRYYANGQASSNRGSFYVTNAASLRCLKN